MWSPSPRGVNLYLMSVMVGCGSYFFLQLAKMLYSRLWTTLQYLLLGGFTGAVSLFLTTHYPCWLCCKLGPWSLEVMHCIQSLLCKLHSPYCKCLNGQEHAKWTWCSLIDLRSLLVTITLQLVSLCFQSDPLYCTEIISMCNTKCLSTNYK